MNLLKVDKLNYNELLEKTKGFSKNYTEHLPQAEGIEYDEMAGEKNILYTIDVGCGVDKLKDFSRCIIFYFGQYYNSSDIASIRIFTEEDKILCRILIKNSTLEETPHMKYFVEKYLERKEIIPIRKFYNDFLKECEKMDREKEDEPQKSTYPEVEQKEESHVIKPREIAQTSTPPINNEKDLKYLNNTKAISAEGENTNQKDKIDEVGNNALENNNTNKPGKDQEKEYDLYSKQENKQKRDEFSQKEIKKEKVKIQRIPIVKDDPKIVAEIKKIMEKNNETAEKISEPKKTIENKAGDEVYDLMSKEKNAKLILPYKEVVKVFNSVMNYLTTSEKRAYKSAQKGDISRKEYLEDVKTHIIRNYKACIEEARIYASGEKSNKQLTDIPDNDIDFILKKIENAVFEMYVLEDAINDDDVSDIKVLAPDRIRLKVKGKRMSSNLHFIDENDYIRFVEGIALRERSDLKDEHAVQNHTDRTINDKAILRINITSKYVNSVPYPYLAIRKTPKTKRNLDYLIKAGMLDNEMAEFLKYCAREGKGMLFTGRGGSGKTNVMNWLLDTIPHDCSGLVIQENEELFSESHPDFMFQHPTEEFDMKKLARNGLLADLDYFIIGEIKGEEAAPFLNATYTGTNCWASVHSGSSRDAINKLADYVKMGADYTFGQAKSMLKNLQYIVYLEKFKIMEISEAIDFDEKKQDIEYRTIFDRKNGIRNFSTKQEKNNAG